MIIIKAKILIVEDEALIAESLKMCLELLGYNVLKLAAAGREAIRLAKQSMPNIVLMDIHLRGSMNGYDTVSKIREFSSVPVIYMTGGDFNQVHEKVKDGHPYDFMIKPYDIDMLVVKMKKLLHKAESGACIANRQK